jgi:hypothetical protein
MNRLETPFHHVLHPRTRNRMEGRVAPPTKVDDLRVGVNGRVGLFITTIVGTMWTAYLFTILALVSFPSAISSGNDIVIVAWIAQTFLQLVLLPIIIVGQDIQSKAADRRAEDTYKDAEAVLHECLQLQDHLTAQDQMHHIQIEELKTLIAQIAGPAPGASSSS